MDVATKISLLFILCGNVHAKDLNQTILAQGNNATIYFDTPKWDGNTLLEINFYGYTSTQHFTNMLLYIQGKDHKENISINSNYTGRIEGVVNTNDHFSFLLLNVMFNDSGNYTIKENSNMKGNTCVLVTRRIYVAQLSEPMILSFTVYENNTSFIRVDKFTSQWSQPVGIYNFTNAICTYRDDVSSVEKNIKNCVLSNGEFSFTIPEIAWLHIGSYFAWDDKGLLLDSIVIDIQVTTTTVSVEIFSPLGNGTSTLEKEAWLIISALGITILAASLVVIAVWKLRVRRARMSTMDNSTSRNGIQTIHHRSNNAVLPEETRRVLTKQNSNDLTELTTNQFHPRFKLNDQNLCVRGLGCSKSSVNTRSNLQIDSSLSSAETIQSDSTHRYDYVHDTDELASDCQSKQHYIRSNLLDTNSIGRKSQTSFEYSYIVQRRFMTLRPPAPEPVLKKKQNQQTIVANSFYSHKQVNKRSIRRYDASILFARKKNQGTMESHRTRSGDNLSLNCTNVVSSPSFDQLDKDFAKKDVDSPQTSRKVKCLKSKVVACMPEPYQFRDSKPGSVSHCSRADYPGDDCDHAYAMDKKHRRSWSNDALNRDRIFNTKAARSRRFSANSKPGSASQCSRAEYQGDDYDHVYAMNKKHRRSWSNDALYGDRIFNTEAPRSIRFSDNAKTGSASQCSRADYQGDDYDQAYGMERRHRRFWSNDALNRDRIFNTKAPRSTRFSASKYSKPGSASQCSRADDPRDNYYLPYAMKRRHRISWSNDALYWDRIFNTKSPRSRLFSASTCTDED